jgi:hypothetical protein
MKCPNGCCDIILKKKFNQENKYYYYNNHRKKAGAFIYDPETNKILLIQSNENLWGPPKGTLNFNETIKECAIREVYEETGLEITPENFTKALNIQNKATYFYMEKPICNVEIPNIKDNDATGIMWINSNCLEKCVKNNIISLSKHCKITLNYFLQIKL